MLNTGQITQPFRALGFIHTLDKLKFCYQWMSNHGRNRQFRLRYPRVVLPPDYMLFESFKLDYDKYYNDGLDTASWLIDELSPYIQLTKKRILDWGCGPARISRHLPYLLQDCEIHATDYNEKTIAWCKKNISAVRFASNNLYPPSSYANAFFDVVYGISIFTHLSAKNHEAWIDELVRILVPGGLLFLTTHGISFKEIMTAQEKQEFDAGKLVVRDKAKEGHRVYGAFHPPDFMAVMFEKHCTILNHTPGMIRDNRIEQDTWILKKNL